MTRESPMRATKYERLGRGIFRARTKKASRRETSGFPTRRHKPHPVTLQRPCAQRRPDTATALPAGARLRRNPVPYSTTMEFDTSSDFRFNSAAHFLRLEASAIYPLSSILVACRSRNSLKSSMFEKDVPTCASIARLVLGSCMCYPCWMTSLTYTTNSTVIFISSAITKKQMNLYHRTDDQMSWKSVREPGWFWRLRRTVGHTAQRQSTQPYTPALFSFLAWRRSLSLGKRSRSVWGRNRAAT